ncbi:MULTISPECIES: Gfo/Idh/MocA family protein [Alphaproteobacteria]|uniref:Oxidoreductase n=2 Tax=Alphaproteobacteria TaxID=28211 RepID=A0A512HH99_9HYPH|nr:MULTISPECIES: Gfo/Idh/MocA family oxidoreductase [Alphaproteobacteria]GEO84818.1 oxidoreductase [Ciceribacter naphthalenivorans]GLR20561.1 oxidoreductase [Ciceribacter naphthalenivorans]GLT03417.1 oxidoreductase [Sphingomonas psychrolutea]
MSEVIDIAVIGAGAIGRTHIDTLARMSDMRLSVLVDTAPGGMALAASLSLPCVPTIEALLASGLAQAAIVATPNETHLPISQTLLRAGIPVLLEKPVAESLDSALQLIAVADETGVPLLVGHHRRHNPIIRAARAAIQSGEIGDLVLATVTCSLAKPDSYFEAAWRREPGAGGPLLINLVHEIDLLRHFFGEIDSVQAIAGNARRGFAVEDTAAVCLAFSGGGLATLCISDAAVGPWAWDLSAGENRARFPAHDVSAHHYAGSCAGLSLPDLTLWRPAGEPDWTRELRPSKLAVTPADPYEEQLSHFTTLIREGGAPLVSARDATTNLIVLDAIRSAAANGRVTTVDLSPLNCVSGTIFNNGIGP